MRQQGLRRGMERRRVLQGLGAMSLAATCWPDPAVAQSEGNAGQFLYPETVEMGRGRYYNLQPNLLLIDRPARSIDLYSAELQNFGMQPALNAREQPIIVSETLSVAQVGDTEFGALAAFSRSALINNRSQLRAALPVYFAPGGGLESAASPIPGVFLVKLRPGIDPSTLMPNQLVYNAAGSQFREPWYTYHSAELDFRIRASITGLIDEPSTSFTLLDTIKQQSIVEDAELDWIKLFAFQAIPDDEFVNPSMPWNLDKIRMPEVWDLLKIWEYPEQANEITIAVLDNGFDIQHQDINFASGSHYDARSNSRGFGNYNVRPRTDTVPGYEAHGTAVAGIVGARANNSRGVAGVAAGCRILPIRVSGAGGNTAHHGDLANGIAWARQFGAKVINFSGTSTESKDVETQIARAVDAGIVICVAAGNQYSGSFHDVRSPARYPGVIAVGASDEDDRRKTYESLDKQKWASCYGEELDVLAPGVNIWTTDMGGTDGFDSITELLGADVEASPNNEYWGHMLGTSAAAAHVSGLAGLLLLALRYRIKFRELDNREQGERIRFIIESSCRKVNDVMYEYKSDAVHHSGWNEEVGYGRIDAYEALMLAYKLFPN